MQLWDSSISWQINTKLDLHISKLRKAHGALRSLKGCGRTAAHFIHWNKRDQTFMQKRPQSDFMQTKSLSRGLGIKSSSKLGIFFAPTMCPSCKGQLSNQLKLAILWSYLINFPNPINETSPTLSSQDTSTMICNLFS